MPPPSTDRVLLTSSSFHTLTLSLSPIETSFSPQAKEQLLSELMEDETVQYIRRLESERAHYKKQYDDQLLKTRQVRSDDDDIPSVLLYDSQVSLSRSLYLSSLRAAMDSKTREFDKLKDSLQKTPRGSVSTLKLPTPRR